jgi:hypothetical protein
MAQTFTEHDTSSDDVPTCLNAQQTRTTTLQSNFSGSSAPASPVEGQLFVDTTTASDLILYFRNNAAWQAVANMKMRANKDCNDKEMTNFRVENLGADPSSAAGKAGRLFHNTADGKWKGDDGSAIVTLHSGTVTAVRELPLTDGGKDASNPPTIDTVGTTPTVRGLLFDATNELYSFSFRVPQNWDGASDLTLHLDCALDGAEANGDDIDWTMDWVAAATTEDLTKTSTANNTTTDIGNATSAGEFIRCALTFDYDDGDNPITAGDRVVAEIHRSDLAEVDGVVLVGASLQYTATNAG